jgi:hypothetical protein
MDDFSLGLGRLNVLRARAMAFFTSDIELHIFGFISPVNFLQLEPSIMATCTAHIKGFLYRGFFETPILMIPILQIIGNPPRSRLIPLEWENVMMISNLDLIALFPTPSPKSPRQVIGDLLRKVFCIH